VLERGHVRDSFDCGALDLDLWIVRHAWQAHRSGSARVFVALAAGDRRVAGYFALTAAEIDHVDATARIRKGMPHFPIPAVLVSRLAVDLRDRNSGVGKSLLKDAFARVIGASQTIGIRAILVSARDDDAAAFYEHFGFSRSPTDPGKLLLLLKDARGTSS
jgi:GNAT superfamily N-acetyltransferase